MFKNKSRDKQAAKCFFKKALVFLCVFKQSIIYVLVNQNGPSKVYFLYRILYMVAIAEILGITAILFLNKILHTLNVISDEVRTEITRYTFKAPFNLSGRPFCFLVFFMDKKTQIVYR